MPLGLCTQQWVRNEVISSQPQQRNTGIENFSCGAFDLLDHPLGITDIEIHIPVIDDAKALTQIELPGPDTPWILADKSRLLAQRPRSETRARPVRRGEVKWNADNCKVYAL